MAAQRNGTCFEAGSTPPATRTLTASTSFAAAASPASTQSVWVSAPARLHLGFLDPSATSGRRFGSLGLVIEGFETVLEITAAASDQLVADSNSARLELPRLRTHLAALRQHSGCHQPLRVQLHQALPAHAGLGSGTQLALALGRAFAAWHGLDLSTATLASWLGRGQRSGVGIAGFDAGGLLLDGGPGALGQAAPLLSRIAFPEHWRVLVVADTQRSGLSGADERNAIARLAPLPRVVSAELCQQVLMAVLPGAAEAHFASFAAGINRMQQVLGEHFAPAQGGRVFTSPAVERCLSWMTEHAGEESVAVGQSSWGPTGFAIVASTAQAQSLQAAAEAAGVVAPGLALHIVRGRNQGAALKPRTRNLESP
jgi:beta-ribofuranosylaminobenzene 5'-phosphate synthase